MLSLSALHIHATFVDSLTVIGLEHTVIFSGPEEKRKHRNQDTLNWPAIASDFSHVTLEHYRAL